MRPELKPCPFCGKHPQQDKTELQSRPCFYYECENPKCQASEKGWHDTEQEAVAAWNQRPIEDALRSRIAELETKIKPAYVMTLSEYTKQYIDNHAYKDKYEQAKKLNILEKQAQDEWIKSLKEQAQKGRLSDKSIDSYVHAFGAGSLQSVFRGVYAKGIEGWIPADIRNAPKESAKERLQERLNKLERQLLEPDYKVSSKEKAKIRAKIKGIIKKLQATVPAPAPAPKTAIITDRQSFQARIAELEHKLANYQAAADGDTHWCAECKMKDERIAELEKRATRLAQEYCELAEVWQKHECNPAPPEEVSNDNDKG